MPKKRKKISLRWQALTSTISTTFVLILLGLILLCGLTAHRLTRSVRESLTVTLVLNDEANDTTARALQRQLERRPWVSDITYISREQALKEQTEAMGSDPTEFLDENPYTPLLEMHLGAEYACTDSLLWISKQLKAHSLVDNVVYQKDLVERLNSNLQKATYVLLGLASLLLVVTLVLINNTVRLSVYSRRFVIHTMKLVGASWSFIRRPFMMRSFWIGLSAGILANGVLAAGLHTLWNYDPNLLRYIPLEDALLTGVAVLASGLLLTLVCTFVSVGHYLSMREGDLYE